MTAFVVTGTDTGIGKTVFAAGLAKRLNATYWKPVQSGLEEETDSQIVSRLSGQPVHAETYRLQLPASPHIAAAREGVTIDDRVLTLPSQRPLVIEGAGGLMVPLNDQVTFLDMFARWQLPIILCARTSLGTINHSLLSIAALRWAGVALHGVAFIGKPEPHVEATICRIGEARHLGRLPWLDAVTVDSLSAGFDAAFAVDVFATMAPNSGSRS
ncbi:MAG: Dethiobiotin synthetase [uncultured bacterium]|uniref:dethiobiotin synthase n=1 Tax=Tabrizicola sp. TaxID=2005166 RepID=UPI0002856415|nr:dethiobiotin synthase [Tabrizicola sp.]EKD61655.1 MAG: Dethiobiotin synthetase [uncultured bacterium]MDP3197676.1 dethiobiotin synthase [Tabrizicola sp.]MDZ4065961.1 dethiobiotin synthase [Tabrizicola sp.]